MTTTSYSAPDVLAMVQEADDGLPSIITMIVVPSRDAMARMHPGLFNPYDYFLQHATRYYPQAAGTMGSVKQCYSNSILNTAHGMTYVEGYTLVHGVPIQHAWNIQEDGTAVDYTIPDPERWEYWGVPWPMEVAHKVAFSRAWPRHYGVLNTIPFLSKAMISWIGKRMQASTK